MNKEAVRREMSISHTIYSVFVVSAWFCGIVLAKGFLSTAVAICFPPWGWYLVAERALQVAGWL